MMTFVDMDRPGLVILPTHRLVFGLPSFSPAQFEADARKLFNVEQIDARIDAARATAILRHAGIAGTALLAVTAEGSFLLHSPKALGTRLFSAPAGARRRAVAQGPARRCTEDIGGGHSQ